MIDARTAPYAALILRVTMGVLFILHGLYLKVFVFSMAGAAGFFETLGLPRWFAWIVMLCETIGGIMLILGIEVRAVAVCLGSTCLPLPGSVMLETVGCSPIREAAGNFQYSGRSFASL